MRAEDVPVKAHNHATRDLYRHETDNIAWDGKKKYKFDFREINRDIRCPFLPLPPRMGQTHLEQEFHLEPYDQRPISRIQGSLHSCSRTTRYTSQT